MYTSEVRGAANIVPLIGILSSKYTRALTFEDVCLMFT